MAADLAAKAMEGSAKMVLESGEHPIQLANNVCSPGGSTIEGVSVENKGNKDAQILPKNSLKSLFCMCIFLI